MPYNGPLQFRTNGQVIENVEIQTPTAIYLPASNVTFRNVRIVYTGPLDGTFTVIENQGQNNTFEDVEIDGRSNVYRGIAGPGTNTTIRACHMHQLGKPLEVPGPLLVEDNYFDDIKTTAGTEWHSDGVMSYPPGVQHDITIRHNTIILTGDETGAINIHGTASNPAANVLIENNLFAGGSYTMYAYGGQNYQILNNHFSTRIWPKVGRWGIWYLGGDYSGVTRRGNVIDETGSPADD
jgi:hypothetical protein